MMAALDAPGAPVGPLLETFVAGEVLKQISWTRTRPALHHFRSYRQEEVDLLLEAPDRRIVGIEVKASARVEPRDFRHLARLRDDLGERFVNGFVMHTGGETVAFGDRLQAVPVGGGMAHDEMKERSMYIRVREWKEAFPESGFDDIRFGTYANCALDYYYCCEKLWQGFHSERPAFNCLFPSMHQCLELLLKATASRHDPAFNARCFSHRTCDLVVAYSDSIPEFKRIRSDSQEMTLLKELENAYLIVRYGEGFVESEGRVWQVFKELSERLFDHLHVATGIKLLRRHFEQF